MFTKILFLVIFTIKSSYGLTCDELLEMPEDKKITLTELKSMQLKHIVECLAHLGKDKLPEEETLFIWQSIVKHYGGVANVPDNDLMLLHWITPALQPDDYSNITLSNIDVIQNFGFNYNLSPAQLGAIADCVRADFASKEPSDYTYYDLSALRQILCAFNRSDIENIRPSAYREASLIVGKLEHCGEEAMVGFATLAVQPTAFGHPATWTSATLETIGEVAKFLPREYAYYLKNIK